MYEGGQPKMMPLIKVGNTKRKQSRNKGINHRSYGFTNRDCPFAGRAAYVVGVAGSIEK